MTLKELSQLYYICKAIEREQERIIQLRTVAEGTTSKFSDMPKAHDSVSKIENMVLQICESEERLQKSYDALCEEASRLNAYIDSIEDMQTRLIMQYRFVDMIPTWDAIAAKLCKAGYDCSADSVKKRCYRYIRKSLKCPQCPE